MSWRAGPFAITVQPALVFGTKLFGQDLPLTYDELENENWTTRESPTMA